MVLGDWRLTIASDRFSGERRCRLGTRKGQVRYARGTVAVRLSRIFDPSETVIRVDGGIPVRWRDLIPELARLDPSFSIDSGSRQLLIPSGMVKNAQVVAVAPAFGKPPRAYRVAGLGEAMERAVAYGCRPDAAFVR